MVNILETQQHANKELSSEIEALKKQLTDKEQETEQLKEDLKLKIWHITGQPTDAFWYKKLNQKWLDEGKLRMAIDPNETREWAKNCERVRLDNITIEEMLEDFCNSSKELASTCARYISNWSQRGYQLTKQKQEYKKKNRRIEYV